MIRFLLSLILSLALTLPVSAQLMLGGSGAPVRSVGSEGQFYFNTANGSIYGPKAFNAWPSPTTPTYPVPSSGCTTLNVLYNNAGSLGCMTGTSWDNTNRALTLTGTTVTTSNPVLNLTQTWNAGAVQFIGISANFTATASTLSSLPLRIQVGSSDILTLRKDGFLNLATAASILGFNALTFITSPGTNSLQFGLVDSGIIAAQTTGVQSILAGTSNTAGATWTQRGSRSTGSAVSGDIVFQTGAANAAATTQNAGVTILTLKGSATTTDNPGRVLVAGQIESSGSVPTAAGSGGTCATGAIAGGANAGTVTLTGVCAATNTITLTFKTASATGWGCVAANRAAATTILTETSTTTTTAVLTVSGVSTGATDVIQYACTAY